LFFSATHSGTRELAGQPQLQVARDRLRLEAQALRHVGVPVLVEGIQVDDAGHLVRKQLGVAARVAASDRVRDQHVRGGNAGGAQQLPQLGGDLRRGAWQVSRVTPAGAGTVVEDRGRERADPVVDVEVVQADGAGAGQEHHGRPCGARAMQQQAPPLDLVEAAQRGLV
jgi:hypothetical protein